MRVHYSVACFLVTALALVSSCVSAQRGDTIESIKAKHKKAAKPAPQKRSLRRTPPRTPRASAVSRPPALPQAPRIVVSPLGNSRFRTIGQAIRASKPGAHIFVRSGVYVESVVIDRPVEISPDVDAGEIIVESPDSAALIMRADQAIVRGITLRTAGGGKADYAVDIVQGRLILDNCTIRSGKKGAVLIHGPKATPLLRFCHIDSSRGGDGIHATEGAAGVVEDCDIVAAANGALVEKSSKTAFRSCRIRPRSGTGIAATDGSKPAIEGCDITGGTAGAQYAAVYAVRGASPAIRNCTIHDAGWDGIQFNEDSGGLVEDCEISTCQNGISANHSAPTVRSCRIHDVRDRGIWVLFGGAGNYEGCEIVGAPNMGISITDVSDPVIRRCTIRNSPKWGILVQTSSRGTIDDCDILDCGYAGITVDNGSTTVRACRIHRAVAGVWVGGYGTATVTECDLSGNREGPLHTDPGSRIHASGNKS